ncbi:alanine racemase [Lachnospiraceae bacterium NK3A20]|nr:alanine racemase [Lachnospiraceae bacterium NK3A20]
MNHNLRCEARIDLDAIRYNCESMHRNLHPGTKMIAVVKTDGYGHGAVEIARAVEPLDYLWGYAVATFEEAKELRESDITKPILILGYVFPYCYEELARLEIRPATFRADMLEELGAAGKSTGKPIRIHIAVDTGMSRIGIRPDDRGLSFVKKALETEGVSLEGMFTHFARADEIGGTEATQRQFDAFQSFTKRIEAELGYRIPIIDCSNSASIISHPDMNMDMVRAGITLYGMWPSNEVPKDIVPLRPALSLHSHVVYIKEIEEGTPVSYGGTYVAKGKIRVATIPVGYGDGYPRSLSNKGYVLIGGHRVNIIGRVCMDQFMVDVTAYPNIREGDLVTLIGRDGELEITAEELGDLSGRFNYELTCDLNKRVPRVY